MGNYCRIAALCLSFICIAPILSADESISPAGDWLVKDKTAHIRILNCNSKLWGVISWVDKPGNDSNNPDPAKRGQPVLGLPIILGMQPDGPHKWAGDIYNADNGKIYHSNISLESSTILHVKGCVLGGLICGGEDWTRITPSDHWHGKNCAQLDKTVKY